MKRYFSILLFLSLVMISATAGTAAGGKGIDVDGERQKALKAIRVFAGRLQAELKKGMAEGGPVQAIAVCKTTAGEIAKDVSAQQGLVLQRVSLKVRNPGNAPNDWQRKVLENFEERKRSGETVAGLTYTEVAEVEGTRQFRFMKAIPTKGLCIRCHGANIAPDVQARLNTLYPEDAARGFQPGDIRGAFVVTRDIP